MGDGAVLADNTLYLEHDLPETVVTRLTGSRRPLADLAALPGIDHLAIRAVRRVAAPARPARAPLHVQRSRIEVELEATGSQPFIWHMARA